MLRQKERRKEGNSNDVIVMAMREQEVGVDGAIVSDQRVAKFAQKHKKDKNKNG